MKYKKKKDESKSLLVQSLSLCIDPDGIDNTYIFSLSKKELGDKIVLIWTPKVWVAVAQVNCSSNIASFPFNCRTVHVRGEDTSF